MTAYYGFLYCRSCHSWRQWDERSAARSFGEDEQILMPDKLVGRERRANPYDDGGGGGGARRRALASRPEHVIPPLA